MYTRRVQSLGKRSYVITLPKDWILKSNIKPKTTVYVEETHRGDLLIKKAEPSNQNIQKFYIDVDKVKNVKECIVFSYTRNMEKVGIRSAKPLSYEVRKNVKEIIENLEGYKIIDETPTSIEISFLFKEVTITLPTIIRRIVYLLMLMREALSENDSDTVIRSEVSINRLYHLSTRIMFNCLQNMQIRKEHDIQNSEELFYFKDIVRRLDVIADRIRFIMDEKPQSKDLDYMEKLISMLESALIKKGDYFEIKKTLSSLSYRAKDRGVDIRLKRIHDLSIDIIDNVMDISFNRLYLVKN